MAKANWGEHDFWLVDTAGMKDADCSGDGDRQGGERHQQFPPSGDQESAQREQDRRAMWPALPVAHLARVEPADILREQRSAEEARRDQQGKQACLMEARCALLFRHCQH